jgi:hypothetical protein
MSYGRLEINLLPPELQPGPAVRYSLLINFALISGLLAFLGLDVFLSMSRISMLNRNIRDLTAQVEQRQQVATDYNAIVDIRGEIQHFGQIVGLASARYADMPVVLDRLSRLLPDGVFISSVANSRAPASSTKANVIVTLLAAKPDPRLMQQTLEAFKRDAIFSECYLSRATAAPQALDEYLKQINISWSANGPGYNNQASADEFEFDISVTITQPMTIGGLPVVFDVSRYFEKFKLDLPQLEGADGAQGKLDAETGAGAKAISKSTTASQGMAYGGEAP